MPSQSVAVLDPPSDANREELARLVKVYDFPPFVKRADLQATMQPDRIAVTTYADPRHRRYPCHSAAATWLSGLYFEEKRAEYHPKDQERISQRLRHYADYFGIMPHYERMVKAAAEMHKEADLPDSSYAYVWVDGDGKKERHLPLRSAMEVKAAAEWLHKYQDRLPYHDRNTCAVKILEKAAEFGAGIESRLTDYLEKQAGMGVCDPVEVYTMIMQRAKLTKSAAYREQIEKLAATVKDKPRVAFAPEQMVKLAVTMDTVDRALNLDGRYGNIIKRPEDVIFKATFTKLAADRAELCALTTGNVYSKEQLAKVSADDLEALFGTDFLNEVRLGGDIVDTEKFAEVAHTLPRPDAELLDKLMAETGLTPTMQKAASVTHGLSNEELEQLAAAYETPS